MGNRITSPVELGFSEFVSKLISDTFDAVITSTISQEDNWTQLKQLLALSPEEFAEQVIDDEMIDNELNRLFPDGSGGTLVVSGARYLRRNVRGRTHEQPPINETLGYQPRSNKLTDNDVASIRSILKSRLAEKQFELLNKVFSKGQTKIVVDAGKINAKLNFEILEVDETDENTDNTSNKKIFIERKFPGFTSLARPTALKNVHFFVKPPTDSDPQSHQVKANVYGEVELQFKTIT